jgi:hypothetical protein
MNISDTFKDAPAEHRGATIASILLGIWVFISPFVLGIPAGSAAMWNNIVIGVVVVLLALGGGLKQGAVQGLIVPLSAWLFASTFVLNFNGTRFLWSNVISAFALVAETAYNGALRSFPSPGANH